MKNDKFDKNYCNMDFLVIESFIFIFQVLCLSKNKSKIAHFEEGRSSYQDIFECYKKNIRITKYISILVENSLDYLIEG